MHIMQFVLKAWPEMGLFTLFNQWHHHLQTPLQKEAKTTMKKLRQKRNPANNKTIHIMFDLQQIAS